MLIFYSINTPNISSSLPSGNFKDALNISSNVLGSSILPDSLSNLS